MDIQKRTILSRLHIDRAETILLAVWLLVNLFILLQRGIYLQGESAKYIHQAHLFLETGRVETPNLWLYFLQIALIACCIKIHVGFYFVVILQILVNLAAMLSFYRTTASFFQNKNTAMAGTLLLIVNFPYQEFNSFLYTESFFYSLTLILGCYLIRIKTPTTRNLTFTILLAALICFTRPTGLLFLPPTFLYLLFVCYKNKDPFPKIALLAALSIGFLLLLDKALKSGGELDLMLPFREEQVICGVPTLPGSAHIQTAANGNSLFGLLYYVLHNPVQFIRLAALKTLAFFGLSRSYYSTRHNIYLLLYFQCIHLAALAGIGYMIKRHTPAFCLFFAFIALTWVAVMLTCDDWHNRFYLAISPFIILLSMPAIQRLFILINTRSRVT
jgi:Dolichyl-phosphate-mannose-protein mannosyltransferase